MKRSNFSRIKNFQKKIIPYLDSPENVSNFFPDVETDVEISSHRERAFRMELDRSLNFVVSGPFWLKFEPHGAFCEKFESATILFYIKKYCS